MKTQVKILSLLSAFVASSLFAQEAEPTITTYYYNVVDAASEQDLSAKDNWYSDPEMNIPLTSAPVFDSNTSIILKGNLTKPFTNLNFKKDVVNLYSVDLQVSGYSDLTTNVGGTINIAQNLSLTATAASLNGNKVNVNIGGSLYFVGYSSAMGDAISGRDAIGKLVVEKETYLNNNTNNYSCFFTNVENSALNNPSAIFKGVITTDKTSGTTTLAYGSVYAGTGEIKSTHIWANGLDKQVGFMIQGKSTSDVTTLVLTNNEQDRYTTGFLGYDKHGSTKVNRGNPNQLAITMMSANYTLDADGKPVITNYENYSQHFTGSSIDFSGGVNMISGGLYINYNAVDFNDEVGVTSHGVLTLNQAEGAKTTFGNSSLTCGTFIFDSIAVENGGTIKIGGTADNFDVIQANDGITGEGTIILSFVDSSEFKYEGEGGSESWYKVIAWTNGKTNTANVVSDEMLIESNQYQFKYDNRADGLYVAYVAVPEPSTYAAIFGALALGFAIWRRRK